MWQTHEAGVLLWRSPETGSGSEKPGTGRSAFKKRMRLWMVRTRNGNETAEPPPIIKTL